jgi:hypothetical protein
VHGRPVLPTGRPARLRPLAGLDMVGRWLAGVVMTKQQYARGKAGHQKGFSPEPLPLEPVILSPSTCAYWGKGTLNLVHCTIAILILFRSRRCSVDELLRRAWSHVSGCFTDAI